MNGRHSITGDNKKHDIYWSGSQWYCRNCNQHGDKPYMTKETGCKGEDKDKVSLLNYTTELSEIVKQGIVHHK